MNVSDMRISHGRAPERPSERPPEGNFTGTVWTDTVLSRADGMSVVTVVFQPAARTRWHTHEIAQVLFITHGQGYVRTRDGVGAMVRAGDVIHFVPGEEHWHGAGPDTFLAHTALSIGATILLEEVAEDEYAQALE